MLSRKRWVIAAFSLAVVCLPALVGWPYAVAQQVQPTPSTEQVKPRMLTDRVADPQQAGVQWFSATGHTLRGSFLDYWNSHGGLAQFGYPITEEFTEPLGPGGASVMVQYFERNRFEHHPEYAGTPFEVLLGSLGREFHMQDHDAPALPAPATYFDQTGHNLSGAFKQYWDTHGGLAVHGYPITEQFEEKNPLNGKTYTVQYFERSRFELHPENAGSPYEVLLGQLGTQLAQKKGYPYGWYPDYGHAGDFSWVAGTFLPTRMCFNAECACVYFRYGARDSNEYILPGNSYAAPRPQGSAPRGGYAVLFGYLTNNPPDPVCKALLYHANMVQPNPIGP
jgi:hypothetical protein